MCFSALFSYLDFFYHTPSPAWNSNLVVLEPGVAGVISNLLWIPFQWVGRQMEQGMKDFKTTPQARELGRSPRSLVLGT